MLRETDRFTAVSNNGWESTIVEYTEFVQIVNSEFRGEKAGMRQFHLEDGSPVNTLGNGVYEVASSGLLLRGA